uniref:Ycf56 n=1 Tax=Grateloupia turuturu TaxID=118375 RepID=A0A6B9P441_9FLOR|nr:Ycf56 [Grateloupia turuturu]QHD45219.1 Ycf56 [Grateloupia turuturu]UXC96763.1 Ycf56 [Grateloupia turuturu]
MVIYMDIINLTHNIFVSGHRVKSFALKLGQTKHIWLVNCYEGCQHDLIKKNIKISQISGIILTDLNADSTAGLLGLLSSLSLVNRKKILHIYGPPNLDQYINLMKKYAKTNFCYSLYLHIFKTRLLLEFDTYQVYVFIKKNKEFVFLNKERNKIFQLSKAKLFRLIEGPLYGKLKQGMVFLLPDGFVVDGTSFVLDRYSGIKISFLGDFYINRQSAEISSLSNIIYSLFY